MKGFIRIVTVYLFILISSLVFIACCTDTYRITGLSYMTAYDEATYVNYENGDTISSSFALVSVFESQVVSKHIDAFISSAMATSCENEYVNQVEVDNNFSLSLNDSFVFGPDTIFAGENLIQRTNITTFSSPFEGSASVQFDSTFLNNSVFKNQEYLFTIEMMTSDDLFMTDSIRYFLDL